MNPLTHHGQTAVPYFTDNLMMHEPSQACLADGHRLHHQHQDFDPDFAKGIYNLRPRSGPGIAPNSPIKTDEEFHLPPKQKRPRNSLKKRLLVNARERERMRVLNNAFQSLRDALPCYIADGHMAKITTLRLAINYIKALTDVLRDESSTGEHGGPSSCPSMAVAPMMLIHTTPSSTSY
ncbi:neurogenin-1 [Nematostella vectensis]|nr:neurogenin-1 [Nematostella vectensis]